MPGAPSSGTYRESQVMFRDGTVWVLLKDPVGTGSAGSVFGENSFYRSDRPKAVYPLSRTSKLEA